MKLDSTKNNELIYITTDDLEITIKDESSDAAPPFVVPSTRESKVTVWCTAEFTLAVRGVGAGEVERDTFANAPLPISLPCDPIFFEQRSYSLYAEVRGENSHDRRLEFDHENVSLRKSITPLGRYSSKLSGNLNFRNDIGMSDLIFRLDGQEYLRITIEVYPSKIDYKKDYREILADVTAEVYNLAFDAFRRTYESYSLKGKSDSSSIEFFAIIRKIYREFTIAADMIIARPHHVLQSDHVVLPQHKIRRTDNATLRWLERHPEHVTRVANANGFAADRALAVQKYVTYDTRENRLAKYMLMRTARRLELFKRQYLQASRQNDPELNAEIERMIRGIQRRYTGTFLKNIEAEPSESGMSLVFSMAPGYRDLFKYYLMLQRGLNVTGGVFNVSTKDMAVLYEYWCFIKLNSILRESVYTLESQDFVKVKRNEIAVTLVSGKSSRIRYITDKGERIELYYNPEYDRKKDQSSFDSKRGQVATTPQKPDNVLSLRKKVAGGNWGVVSGGAGVGSSVGVNGVGGSVVGGGAVGADGTLVGSGAVGAGGSVAGSGVVGVGGSVAGGGAVGAGGTLVSSGAVVAGGALVGSGTVANSFGNERCYEYVFDAKYRIGADEVYLQKHHNLPGPKEEDINTMHRYRDAIVYSADKRAAQGASYPGLFDRTMFGAYVLFPYADEKKYEKHDFYKSIETVNVGGLPFLPSATKMVRDFLEELIADSPESAFERATLPSGIEEKLARVDWSHRDVLIVKVPDQAAMDACLAGTSLIVPESGISMEHLPIHHVALYQPAIGIERFGTVLLTQEDAAGNYIFKVDKWYKLARPIGVGEFGVGSVAYTNMFLLTHGEKYPDLHLRSEAEYRLFTELKRRVKEVDYSVTTSGFEFEGKRIELADQMIRFSDGMKMVEVPIEEFERRPGARFRGMMERMK